MPTITDLDSHSYYFSVTNNISQSNVTLNVYSTFTPTPPSDPPSTNTQDYQPVYTLLGSLQQGDKDKKFSTPYIEARIVFTRASDDFPVALAIIDSFSSIDTGSIPSISISDNDLTVTTAGWDFYQSYTSQPYSPVALQFTDLVLNTPMEQLDDAAASFFVKNGFPGLNYSLFSTVSYWATNSVYALAQWQSSFYCYADSSSNSTQLILSPQLAGTLSFEDGKATYISADGRRTVPLTYAQSQLCSSDATDTSGIKLTAILMDLCWKNDSSDQQMAWGFVGTDNGKKMVGQSYSDPSVPWYAVTYDLVYSAFYIVQLGMAIHMAVHFLKKIPGAIKTLQKGFKKLVQSSQNWANSIGDNACPDSDSIGATDIDPINVDVDLNNNVDVQPGMLRGMVNKLGSWILKKGLPGLLRMGEVMVAFQAVSALLKVWQNADSQSLDNMQPRECSGLGLLINFMLDPNNNQLISWNTFADYAATIAEQGATLDEQSKTLQIAIACIQMTPCAAADQAAQDWPTTAANYAIKPQTYQIDATKAMIEATAQAGNNHDHTYIAAGFRALAFYPSQSPTFDSQTTEIVYPDLPVKIGCDIALQYLKLLTKEVNKNA